MMATDRDVILRQMRKHWWQYQYTRSRRVCKLCDRVERLFGPVDVTDDSLHVKGEGHADKDRMVAKTGNDC